ncbi:MAG: hypothetical protein K9K67_10010 [Bacteriovoracaceae bacterium]|nr:hypothetical protein [Bacteriovoracaceae bacterium]
MRNFKKVFATALITGLALSASADIFAQRGPNGNGRGTQPGMDRDDDFRGPRRFGNDNRNRGSQYSVESEFIGKTFYPGERLFLRKELQLGQHKGKEIEKVELEIEGMARGGMMTLLINDQQVSRPQNFYGGRVGDQVITFNLHRPFIIGESARKIQVLVDGTAYIREALVILKSNRQGPDQVRKLEAYTHKDIIGNGQADVSDLVQANYRQQQQTVRFVELEFQSFARTNYIRLCGQDYSRPQFDRPGLGYGRPGYGFDRPGRGYDRPGRGSSIDCQDFQTVSGNGYQTVRLPAKGQKLEDLSVMVRGDLTIKKITVVIEK